MLFFWQSFSYIAWFLEGLGGVFLHSPFFVYVCNAFCFFHFFVAVAFFMCFTPPVSTDGVFA